MRERPKFREETPRKGRGAQVGRLNAAPQNGVTALHTNQGSNNQFAVHKKSWFPGIMMIFQPFDVLDGAHLCKSLRAAEGRVQTSRSASLEAKANHRGNRLFAVAK